MMASFQRSRFARLRRNTRCVLVFVGQTPSEEHTRAGRTSGSLKGAVLSRVVHACLRSSSSSAVFLCSANTCSLFISSIVLFSSATWETRQGASITEVGNGGESDRSVNAYRYALSHQENLNIVADKTAPETTKLRSVSFLGCGFVRQPIEPRPALCSTHSATETI